jgi:hypothetical protein
MFIFCICNLSVAQTNFQNTYADSIYGESTMCISPDAYYLLQTGAVPLLLPKLIKVDLNGNKLWAKTILFNGNAVGIMNIQYHNNGLLVTGAYQNAGYFNFVSKLDTTGNIIWTQQINYGDININTEIISLSSGFLLCGHRDILQGSIYTFDITLARFDDGGNLLWAKAYGTSSLDFDCSAAATASNGDIIIAGNYGVRTPGDYDPMIARFDSSGNLIWMKYITDQSGFFTRFVPTDMCATSDGNFAITGFSNNTNSNYDPHVIKIDTSGSILWAKRLYQIGWQEYGNSIISNSQNEIVAAGHYYLGTDHGNFFVRFDLSGNYLGALQIKNTYRNQTAPFMDIYNSHGNDLYERPGYGYAYSTCFYHDYNHHSQCLITLDYTNGANCQPLNGTYAFTTANIAWNVSTPIIMPTAQTNISVSSVTVISLSIAAPTTDICTLLGIDELNSNSGIRIWPNPVSDYLRISTVKQSEFLEIIEISGKKLMEYMLSAETQFGLEVSSLSDGIYLLKITFRDGSNSVQKWVKGN